MVLQVPHPGDPISLSGGAGPPGVPLGPVGANRTGGRGRRGKEDPLDSRAPSSLITRLRGHHVGPVPHSWFLNFPAVPNVTFLAKSLDFCSFSRPLRVSAPRPRPLISTLSSPHVLRLRPEGYVLAKLPHTVPRAVLSTEDGRAPAAPPAAERLLTPISQAGRDLKVVRTTPPADGLPDVHSAHVPRSGPAPELAGRAQRGPRTAPVPWGLSTCLW